MLTENAANFTVRQEKSKIKNCSPLIGFDSSRGGELVSDEELPAKPKNCLTKGKQMGLVADLPQSWLSTVFILFASRVPVLIYWGLALVEFYQTSIRSDRLSEVYQFKPD
ncbi:MAG TPA: hypothetical protein VIQ31_19315, partial [Phormidium sp.]